LPQRQPFGSDLPLSVRWKEFWRYREVREEREFSERHRALISS